MNKDVKDLKEMGELFLIIPQILNFLMGYMAVVNRGGGIRS